jgi:hypothetical protein
MQEFTDQLRNSKLLKGCAHEVRFVTIVLRRLALQLRIPVVPGSNLSPDILTEVSRGFPQSQQANAGIVPYSQPTTASFQIPFDPSFIYHPVILLYTD